MKEIRFNSSSAMFVFTSSQALVEKAYFRQAVLECYRRKTLRMVVIDEAHLYAMHSTTFREEIRLQVKLFCY